MTRPPILCAIPNVSEGRDPARIRRIALGTSDPRLLDVHSDPDHHRSVLTYAGSPEATAHEMVAMVERAASEIDIRAHQGVHPRLGAVDVLPFVPYVSDEALIIETARSAAQAIADRLDIPVHLYGELAPDNRSLPDLRRGTGPPDLGPRQPHPTAGVICVGVRGPLVAFNVDLRGDLPTARRIALAIRESSGGLPTVRALAFELASRKLVQVSTNLTAPHRIGPRLVFNRVAEIAAELGVEVVDAEVVGLVPDEIRPDLDGLPLRRPARSIGQALGSSG